MALMMNVGEFLVFFNHVHTIGIFPNLLSENCERFENDVLQLRKP